jgi:hypothetical protein
VAVGDHVDALHRRDRLDSVPAHVHGVLMQPQRAVQKAAVIQAPDDRAKRPGIRQNVRQPRARVPRVAITCRAKCSGYPSRMSHEPPHSRP